MPHDAATLSYIEDALSECFKYHNSLDQFLTRSGVAQETLATARNRAETKASVSKNREYTRAPKRFVVQEVLIELHSDKTDGDRIIAAIVTGLAAGSFPDATQLANDAITGLKSKRENDATESIKRREEENARRAAQAAEQDRRRTVVFLKGQADRDTLRDRFLSLMTESNVQRRGYLLETFLNDLCEFEGLDPRGSFKVVGEQIDGSFSWRARTNFVEAKWVSNPVAGAEFGAFAYKIDGKTADTRGLYISINGYSPEAIRGLCSKGSLKFICVEGAHIMRVLLGGENLAELLEKLWRHADETGEAYLPANKLK